MYKIVPAERQGRSKEAITKNRCKPSKNGLQRSFLAPPARLELTTFRLGGGPSILVRYGGIYRNYSVIQGSGIRTVRLLGGGRSILLSYGRKWPPNGSVLCYFSPERPACQRKKCRLSGENDRLSQGDRQQGRRAVILGMKGGSRPWKWKSGWSRAERNPRW